MHLLKYTGVCEDGGDNSVVTANVNRVCVYGSDCNDCGQRFAIDPSLFFDGIDAQAQGPQGPQGDQGVPGAPGTAGLDGVAGNNG